MNLLELVNVSKSFGFRYVLSRVSFSLARGRHWALSGDNGAGKSTLLKICAGLVRPDSGDIRAPSLRRHSIGYVGHEPLLYRDLSLRENLLLFCCTWSGEGEKKKLSSDFTPQIETLLTRFRLEEFLERRIRECSPGVVKRVNLVRTFALQRSIFLFDEPYANLDRLGCEEFDREIAQLLASNVAILSVVHSDEYAERHDAQKVFLANGRLTWGEQDA